MFDVTIQNLKGAGLIYDGDIVLVCREAPSQFAYFGGAIGGAIAAANAKAFILCANEREIRLFDIDKKTGEYFGTFALINRGEIKKATASTFLGSGSIIIKTFNGSHRFQFAKKMRGFVQKEASVRLKELFKSFKS